MSDPRTAIEAARQELARLIPLAVTTLQDLATTAEKESVRLQAAEAILDRSGLGRGSSVHVSTDAEQHREAERAALDLVERLERNRALQGGRQMALEALVVHEGIEEPDELPLAVQSDAVIDIE